MGQRESCANAPLFVFSLISRYLRWFVHERFFSGTAWQARHRQLLAVQQKRVLFLCSFCGNMCISYTARHVDSLQVAARCGSREKFIAEAMCGVGSGKKRKNARGRRRESRRGGAGASLLEFCFFSQFCVTHVICISRAMDIDREGHRHASHVNTAVAKPVASSVVEGYSRRPWLLVERWERALNDHGMHRVRS